jgi:glycerol-3-phosphate dehydrogenase
VELAGALKNIMALSVGYFEGKGFGMSTIGYKLISLYREIEDILPEL